MQSDNGSLKESDQINVLVTGVGSELSFSIIKAIKQSNLRIQLTGCDIFWDVVGRFWCDKFHQVPLARNKTEFISAIQDIIVRDKIDIIIPTPDAEYPVFLEIREKLLGYFHCKILMQNEIEWKRFNDKWQAYQWFIDNNIPTPETFRPEQLPLENQSYPMIVKPRVGGGSRDIFRVNDIKELQKAINRVPAPIVQEMILPDSEEYTAGTFKWKSGRIDCIVMRRELKFGMTNKAWIVKDKSLEEFCRSVISNTNLTGSNNIQFRVNHSGPKVLEINHRFSGTTGIRAKFGFNDAEMWIRDSLDLPMIDPEIRTGKVVRYMEDIYEFE